MLIDWFTVGAQLLNFVALVWLMQRFLYQPVLDAIAAREKRITEQIADAAAQQTEAASERKAFEDKNQAFDQARAELLSKARADALAEGQRLAREQQQAATALAEQRQQALASQAVQLQQLIAGRAAQEVFAVARKALSDLANVALEERMVEVFLQRLNDLPADAKAQLGTAFKQGTEQSNQQGNAAALLRSHFELTLDQRAAIQQALKQAFAAELPLRFETAGDAVCGIELSAGGQKLAWTIAEYLRDLEQNVAALLAPAARPAA